MSSTEGLTQYHERPKVKSTPCQWLNNCVVKSVPFYVQRTNRSFLPRQKRIDAKYFLISYSLSENQSINPRPYHDSYDFLSSGLKMIIWINFITTNVVSEQRLFSLKTNGYFWNKLAQIRIFLQKSCENISGYLKLRILQSFSWKI